MKKYFCMLLCTILMSSCVFTKVKLSGHVSEHRTPVTEFTRLQVSSAINVTLCDSIDEIIVTADDSLHRYLNINQEDKTLAIGLVSGICLPPHASFDIKVPAQTGLHDVSVSGASSVTVTDVSLDELVVSISGASRMRIIGKVKTLDVDISGASELTTDADNGQFQLEAVEVKGGISGASHMDVHSDSIIGCSVSGASSITYSGTADASRTSCSGVSSISHN